MVKDWLEDHGLRVALEKTEAVILKGPYKRNEVEINVADRRVPLARTTKYLGVFFDTRGYFGAHVLETIKKAERRVTVLAKIMPNITGPNSEKRKVLWGIVCSTILYAAPIWHHALRIGRYGKKLESVQRKFLLRVGSAYRTVSGPAIQIITGVPPIDLLVEERVRMVRDEQRQDAATARRETVSRWQERCQNNTTVAQWTKRLIWEIQPWLQCSHKRTNYPFTQFLSGHGSFRNYTKKIGKNENAKCIYCNGRGDSAEHTVF